MTFPLASCTIALLVNFNSVSPVISYFFSLGFNFTSRGPTSKPEKGVNLSRLAFASVKVSFLSVKLGFEISKSSLLPKTSKPRAILDKSPCSFGVCAALKDSEFQLIFPLPAPQLKLAKPPVLVIKDEDSEPKLCVMLPKFASNLGPSPSPPILNAIPFAEEPM